MTENEPTSTVARRPREPEPESSPATGRTLRQVIARLATAFDRDLSPGAMAALRRLSSGDAGGSAFWRVVAGYLEDQLPPGGEPRDVAERRWAALLCGMATTAGLNRAGRSAGEALAAAGLSEQRFDRLLRATGVRLHDELRTAARFVASRGEELDWTDLARLVLTEGTDAAESARRALARRYYRTLHRLETT